MNDKSRQFRIHKNNSMLDTKYFSCKTQLFIELKNNYTKIYYW